MITSSGHKRNANPNNIKILPLEWLSSRTPPPPPNVDEAAGEKKH
jgi:hypothetical protein